MNSGSSALLLAVATAEIEPGDEVLVSASTNIATALAVFHNGATIVPVDSEDTTWNLDLEILESLITKKTRAIIPVHLFGQPANMDEINSVADKHGLFVLEDCAQSFGSCYRKRMTGTIGDAGAYSFFPSKNLGCYGDGGMVTTDDDEVARQIRIYRNHGSSEQYHHDVIGYNSRLDELQAVILRIKLKHIDEYNQNRLKIAETYNRLLAGKELQTPLIPKDRDHIFHIFTLLTERRDQIREAVIARGIACSIYYPIPLHQQKAFAGANSVHLPITESVTRRCLSLPIYPEMSEQQVEAVCEAVLNI